MRIKDTKGKESTTLTIVVACIVPIVIKFFIGGLTLPFGLGVAPVIGAAEYGLALTGLIGVWLNREWKEAKYGNTK
jgi:hypothetical protein